MRLMQSNVRGAFLTATVMVLLGCPSEEGPRPLSIEPRSAALGSAVAVQVLGEGFAPLVRANYDDEGQSSISTDFNAVLGGHPLQQVRYVSSTELSAVVPASLPAGLHSLSLEDPSGARGTLANAFTVIGPVSDGGPLEGGTDGGGDGATDGPNKLDTTPSPDQGSGPLSTTQISAALQKVKVQCIDHKGNPKGGMIPILDTKTVTLVQGSVTLAGVPNGTKVWVGGKPSVCVIWDLNACDREDPWSNDGDWSSAGLLIRGATLSAGKLVLSSGTKTSDMNLLNVTASGAHQSSGDFVQPTDATLSSYPHLVKPVNAAKSAILSL